MLEINDVVTIKIQARNYYPNYMVLHDLNKEDLYRIAESVSDFGVVVIPIYTRGVYEVVDFSDYNHIDFSGNIIRPFYVGDNKELEREVVSRTINMIYEQIERKW